MWLTTLELAIRVGCAACNDDLVKKLVARLMGIEGPEIEQTIE
jgi:hypothetical protein